MTIVTHQWSENKKPANETNSDSKPLVDTKDVESSRNPSLVVTWKKAHRVNSLATIFVLLIGLLLFATGFIGSIYLYRQFTQYKVRHLRGWFSVPLSGEDAQALRLEQSEKLESESNDSAYSPFYLASKLIQTFQSGKPPLEQFFDQKYDVDLENSHFTRIEVPSCLFFRGGRFIHDFVVNKTGILDLEEKRCFVMPLNQSLVLPPKPFLNVILKLQSGFNDVDVGVMRQSFLVMNPPISDLKQISYYITRECSGMPTYNLQMIQSPIFKRNTQEHSKSTLFAEFAGSMLHEINIINS